ncbi:hypothetical protein [Segatella copri]|uniref:hypothetical protein n=1 Tax=Segatella copri TaxID=165179 RepID=UPI003F70DDA3
MTSLQERLFAMQDKQYAAFQAKLTPGVPMESFIGIRVPVLRKFAKEFTKETEYLEIPASVRSDEYYVKMMVAWFFATALAKQWDQAIPYIEQNRLVPWTHNKTIQKAIESYRITPEQKEYLRTLKINNYDTRYIYILRLDRWLM